MAQRRLTDTSRAGYSMLLCCALAFDLVFPGWRRAFSSCWNSVREGITAISMVRIDLDPVGSPWNGDRVLYPSGLPTTPLWDAEETQR